MPRIPTCRGTGALLPAAVQERFPRAISRHRLRREIIATATTNSLVNRMGPTFVPRAQEDTGAEPAQIARAYTAAREIFTMRDLWERVEALDNQVTAKLQYEAAFQTSRLLRHATYWLLTSRASACRSMRRSLNSAPACSSCRTILPMS